MGKIFTAMGLMSGTSLDGVDVSIIESDGKSEYSSILDRYYEYDDKLTQKIHEIRDKISPLLTFINTAPPPVASKIFIASPNSLLIIY